MTTRSWIRKMFESRTLRTTPARRRLSLEALEDRAVPTVSFGTAVAYGSDGPPQSVMTLRIPNTSGTPDLVTVDPSNQTICLLQGVGDGSFQNQTVSYIGNSSGSLAVGDFDGDGYADVATADPTNHTVAVSLASTNFNRYSVPNFTPGVGTDPASVAAGDFNGDNKLDLAAVNHDAGTVTVVRGNLSGFFQAPGSTSNTGPLPVAVAVGDFNLDGKLDLVTANSANRTVSVLLGNGDFTFQTAVSYAAGSSPSSVAVGDFNGDGKLDLVVANAGDNNVSVLRGNGNGTFQTAVSYAVGVDPTSVAVGDLNNDGHPDLVTANTGSDDVSVLMNNGSGGFLPQSRSSVQPGGLGVEEPTSVAIGDFDGDGKPDLVTANAGTNTVSVLLNTSILSIGANQTAVTGNEGSKTTNTGAFDDPFGPGGLTLTASLGTVAQNTTKTGWTWSYTPPVGPAGPTTVSITATNTHGQQATTSFILTVRNVAPTITTYTVPATGAEGSLVQLSGAATDPGGANDPLTYTWTVYSPDGTQSTLTGTNPKFTPPDNGSYLVDLTVTDSGGASTSATLRKSLVSLYRGESNANDTMGAHNSTAVGGVTFVPGKVGQAFNFDGVTGVVNLPNNVLTYPTSGSSTRPLSFATWFRTTTGGVILGQQGTGASGYVPAVYVGTDGKLYAEMFWNGAGNPVVSAGTVNDGQWHQVAVTYNGTSETVYLDGAAIKTVPFTQTAYDSTGYSYTLGSGIASGTDGWPAAPPSPTHSLYPFKGQLDEPAFYNRALSATDVQTIFNVGNFAPVQVSNVAPTPALTGFTTGLATEVLTYKPSATDPSPVDTTAGFTYKINWGDGSAVQSVSRTANNGTGVSLTHVFTTAGTYTISLTATDKDGGATTVTKTVTVLAVTSANLQTVITQQGSITTQDTNNTQAQTMVNAVNGLAVQTKPVTITMQLGSGNFTDTSGAPHAGITLAITGSGGTTTIVGHSPALRVSGGNVIVENLTLVTDTNSPTLVISGGNVMLRNVHIEGSSTGSQAALDITGGTVDLGTASHPGGNTFNDNGTGQLIHNTGPNGVSAVGDTWQVGGTPLTNPYRIKDEIFDALNPGGGGLVTYIPGNDYISANGGIIQLGVNAIATGGTVNVEAGGKFMNYTVGSKPVTIAFQNGPVLTQKADSLAPSLLSLVVTGTAGNDNMLFNLGGSLGGTVTVLANNLPQGVFSPTGRLIASGVAGNDNIEVAGSVRLPAWLYGGIGNDRLKGGGGNNVLIGRAGSNELIGGGGSNLLIGGSEASTLNAGNVGDLLIAGTTAYDANEAALSAILAEWTSGRTYATRIANLSGTGSGPRSNGNYFLIASGPSATVFDNGAADVLNGGSGLDQFFASLSQDIIHGQRSSEVVESL